MGRRSSKSKILYYNIPALPILKVVRIGNIKEQTLATWIHFKIVMLSERSLGLPRICILIFPFT